MSLCKCNFKLCIFATQIEGIQMMCHANRDHENKRHTNGGHGNQGHAFKQSPGQGMWSQVTWL